MISKRNLAGVIIVMMGMAVYGGDHKNPFAVYNRKIAGYLAKSGSKIDKKTLGKIETQIRMKKARYAQLKKQYEKAVKKLKSNIEGREYFIEKFPEKKASIEVHKKMIAKNNDKLKQLKVEFDGGVEAFWTEDTIQSMNVKK